MSSPSAFLLDHILLSPALYWGALRNARIEHEAFEQAIDPSASDRMHHPSDHSPVTASLSSSAANAHRAEYLVEFAPTVRLLATDVDGFLDSSTDRIR